jgi:hypothetical protein
MQIEVGTLMLACTGLASLVGVIIGCIAWWRSLRYDGEQSRLLQLLAHHCIEPALTIGMACLALIPGLSGCAVLALCSFVSLLRPFWISGWDAYWLGSYNQSLGRWACARIGTCVMVWLSAFFSSYDLISHSEPAPIGVTTVIGTLVLWSSLISAWSKLRDFPALPRQVGGVGAELS